MLVSVLVISDNNIYSNGKYHEYYFTMSAIPIPSLLPTVSQRVYRNFLSLHKSADSTISQIFGLVAPRSLATAQLYNCVVYSPMHKVFSKENIQGVEVEVED